MSIQVNPRDQEKGQSPRVNHSLGTPSSNCLYSQCQGQSCPRKIMRSLFGSIDETERTTESNRNRKEELGQGRISRENKRPRHGYHGFVPPLTTRKFFFPLLLILQLFLLLLLAKSFLHLLSQDIIVFVLTLCRSPGQLKVRGYEPLWFSIHKKLHYDMLEKDFFTNHRRG